MFADYLKRLFLAALAVAISLPSVSQITKAEDIMFIDLTAVDPSARGLFNNAEAFWEDRIAGYSTEIPTATRNQITRLVVTATVMPIDGPGGVLGAAGPDGIIGIRFTDRQRHIVSVTASMFFDIDDFPQLEADGILEDVIIHELCHTLGYGTLWEDNVLLTEFPGDNGEEMHYTGRYGLQGYGQDIGSLSSPFVPVEQDGGPGTALGHWDDAPPFFNRVFTENPTKEIMTGFLCDIDPTTGAQICAPKFVALATLGSLADVGFAIDGFNGQFAAPPNANPAPEWPKVVNPRTQNQLFTAGERAAGLRFDLKRNYVTIKASKSSIGNNIFGGAQNRKGPDPYQLRNNSWAK